MVGTTGRPLPGILIRPMDRYGNPCNFGDVQEALFDVQVFQLLLPFEEQQCSQNSEAEEEKIMVEALVFNFTREIKRVIFKYKEFFIIWLINGSLYIFSVRI